MAACSRCSASPSIECPQQDRPLLRQGAGAEACAAGEGPTLQEDFGESSCDSSASDGSLESSELSSSSSSARVSDKSEEHESDAEEQGEEVSSSGQGACQLDGQPLGAAVDQAAQSDCSLAMLPSQWLAMHAIPTTHDLEEALRSNGRLAYVPASAAPTLESALPPPGPGGPQMCAPLQVKARARQLLTRCCCDASHPTPPYCRGWDPIPVCEALADRSLIIVMQVLEHTPVQSPTSPTSVLALSPGGASAFGSPIAWTGNPFEAAARPGSPGRAAAAHAPQPASVGASPLPHGCCAWAGASPAASAVARRQQQLVCSMLDSIGHGKSPRARQLEVGSLDPAAALHDGIHAGAMPWNPCETACSSPSSGVVHCMRML